MADGNKTKADNVFHKAIIWLHGRILNLYDLVIDLGICHMRLGKYVPSVFRDDKNGVGSTGSQSTHYLILDKIFSRVELTENDSFIDIGCGKGRVIAYLIRRKAPCKISGVEINEVSGKVACEWSKRYENVNVIIGNAFDIDFNGYNVFFLGRPFLPKTFTEFIEKMEGQLTHPVTFIYWVDQQSGYLLKDRKGWTMLHRGRIHRIKGLYTCSFPQGCSVWTYDPDN